MACTWLSEDFPMFPPDFARTIDPERLAGATEPKGLALVDEVIRKVIGILDEQVGALAGLDIEAEGHIPPGALGAGDVSQRLAHHYGRAHRVVVDTLQGFEKELREFHGAVIDAKKLARDTDERAAADIAALARMARDLPGIDDRSRHAHRSGASSVPEVAREEQS